MTKHDDAARRAALAAQLASDLEFGIEALAAPRRAPAAEKPKGAPETPPVPRAPGGPPAPTAPGVRSDFVPRVAPLKRLEEPAAKRALLDALHQEVERCTLCKLHRTRTRGVPGEGNADADLMFVGEGPGAEEDQSGRPFVGRAGELLTRIILAMGFTRETVYIANIVKSRPPENRVPEPDEIGACMPYLDRQIDILQPKVICTLGLPATRALLKIQGGISAVRGKKFQYRGIPVVPTFHPAYLLRNPAEKDKVWKDVQVVTRLVAELGGVIPRPEALRGFDKPSA